MIRRKKTSHPFGFSEDQVRALWVSAEHWLFDCVDIKEGEPFKLGPSHCECCERWLESGFFGCRGCPVANYTGIPGCIGTPYAEAVSVARKTEDGKSNLLPAFHKEAENMYRFLVCLALGDKPGE
jgi:hypothetical protein